MSIDTKPTAGADALAVGDLQIVPMRRVGRWIAAVVVGLALVGVLISLATNSNFGWPTIGHYFFSGAILAGLWATIWLTVVSMVIAIVVGVAIALMRLSPNPVLRTASGIYVWLFRGTPLLVQVLFLYNITALYPNASFFGAPIDLNSILSKPVVAIAALALNEGAYAAEIIRAGISSVDRGQTEAAQALGLRRARVLRRIVLPQAMRVIVPPLFNDTISLLKYTSLVSVIAMPELLYSAQIIYSQNFLTIPLLMVASIWYLVVTTVLSIAQAIIERRLRHQHGAPSSFLLDVLRRVVRPRTTSLREAVR